MAVRRTIRGLVAGAVALVAVAGTGLGSAAASAGPAGSASAAAGAGAAGGGASAAGRQTGGDLQVPADTPLQYDIAGSVTPASVYVGRGQNFTVDLTVRNLGTVALSGGDFVNAQFQQGLRLDAASGDGWACTVTDTLFCRIEGTLEPGAAWPVVHVTITADADHWADLNQGFDVAGWRRSEQDITNNSPFTRVRIAAP
ncbi:hypothetical protein [Goodfellowiella coeruleoviolacea]|uniref:DUF11 domain-containing protein n=1 Tax=Goodfellowiella coeruleoviolacea TaxID=334858 RepID=A0AAE3GNA4_9PSEU|nr:hypothetical protein [Goodfellowiella coeruleoviolacea]MCP2170394.1 hypothetical protein [Goodfellowiella coeruleoviolacea]